METHFAFALLQDTLVLRRDLGNEEEIACRVKALEVLELPWAQPSGSCYGLLLHHHSSPTTKLHPPPSSKDIISVTFILILQSYLCNREISFAKFS